jgi:hypothetical protein
MPAESSCLHISKHATSRQRQQSLLTHPPRQHEVAAPQVTCKRASAMAGIRAAIEA